MDTNIRHHYSHVRGVLILVFVLNWVVAAAKILYGLLTHCSSMTADGFHSLSDGASNIIGLVGIRFASQPKDQDHPYGHRKYETLFSMGIGALLVFVCLNLLKGGVARLYRPVTPEIDIQSFVVMTFTLLINIGVMKYENKRGRALQSDILTSDAMHTRADIFTSLSVIVTLVAIKLGFPLMDPIATIMIAIFIGHSALEIFRESSRVLCDTAVIIEEKRIADIVLGIKGVKTYHKIRTRGRPDEIYVDLHVQVNPDMHVAQAHKVSYAIEEAIKKNIPEVADVVVHIEPKEKV